MNLKNSIAPCELHEMTVKEPYFTLLKMNKTIKEGFMMIKENN